MQCLIYPTISFFISLIQNMQGTYVRTWIDIPEKDRIKYSSMWDCILLKISNWLQIYLDVLFSHHMGSVWKLTTLLYNWILLFRNANCFVIVKINWGHIHGKSLGEYFFRYASLILKKDRRIKLSLKTFWLFIWTSPYKNNVIFSM